MQPLAIVSPFTLNMFLENIKKKRVLDFKLDVNSCNAEVTGPTIT